MQRSQFLFIHEYKGSKYEASRIVAEQTGLKANAVRAQYNKAKKTGRIEKMLHGEDPKPIEQELAIEQLQKDLQNSRNSGELAMLKKKYQLAIKEIDSLNITINEITNTRSADYDTFEIAHEESNKTGSAIPVIMISDVHAEETVAADVINNLNEYSLEICQKRMVMLFQNALKLVNKERNAVKIDDVIVWLGGDMITGYIHEELEESNGCSPTEAIRFIKRILISGIEFMLAHGKFRQITVVCNHGNHGRTQKKKRVSTGYKNSYEYMMYLDIADYFKNNSKIKFVIAKGIYAYVMVYDKYTLRFFHGDHIRFQGGVGGITIPVNKMLAQAQKQRYADYNFMAHFHQFFEVANNCICNGSVIGYGPYAQSINASPEEPVQGFVLIDKDRGKTGKFPIFLNHD